MSDDYLKFLMASIEDYNNRKVARYESKSKITVSTVWTDDMGYETALLDSNGAHPVERYGTIEEATSGHEKWTKFADNVELGKTIVTELGDGNLIKSEEITLSSLLEPG